MMNATRKRPLSPHLTAYKWGPHMLVSIAQRVMAVGLATAGVGGFLWWLVALAIGKDAYEVFLGWAAWPPALIIPIGLSFAVFLHGGNGIRHFMMDTGAGYALKTSRASAQAVIGGASLLTIVMWSYILLRTA
jgi:succinate dehydrogenase / fumarate reductase, cytochrome b subunit